MIDFISYTCFEVGDELLFFIIGNDDDDDDDIWFIRRLSSVIGVVYIFLRSYLHGFWKTQHQMKYHPCNPI